jgi:formylglycine-generating enzyme required for sulfatase activity
MTPGRGFRAAFASVPLAILLAAGSVSAADRGVAVVYKAPPGGRGGLSGNVTIYEHSLAVVIGIDQYQSANVPALTGAVRDAVSVSEALKAQGFGVTILINEKATRKGITRVLGDVLPDQLGASDRAIVYFAGHGMTTGKGDRQLGYLVPADGDRDAIRSTGISMTELNAWFADYPCKHVMFVADACYSGLALSTRAMGLSVTLSDYLLQITRKPVRLVMTAGGAGQAAHEWQGHGLFTHFFLAAISGSADADGDGIVTSDELAAYVKPNVARTAIDYMREEQSPLLGRNGEGEFVFLTGRTAVPASQARVMTPAPAAVSPKPVAVLPRPRVRPKVMAAASVPVAAAPSPAAAAITGRDGAPMVLIPAGEFTMGSNDGETDERPSHRVSISAFYLDKYEVTFDLYDKFCDATGRAKPSDSGLGRGSRPVINVTWDDAKAYCDWAGKRLPTEAEWEYACRAGSTGKFSFGDDEGRLFEYAWYSANSGRMTHPVGERSANAWGLYDMHGNVWEWCADWYDAGYYAASPVQDPTGAVSGKYRVLRGGSWYYFAVGCRSAFRFRYDPWDGSVGFRCAASPRAR